MSDDPTRREEEAAPTVAEGRAGAGTMFRADAAATVADPAAAVRVEAQAQADGDLHDLLLGTMIGSYRIDAVLGRGGMGVVYKAWDTRLDRAVALKTVLLDSRETLARFRREARTHAGLRHSNVVPVHVIDEHAGLTYLVMDLVEGGTLKDLLDRERRLDTRRALAIVDGVARALGAAHARGLVHRDVKPSNILLDIEGQPLLSDFGIARELMREMQEGHGPMSAPRSLRTRGVIGTPAYFPPEQARGEPVDHRADIYALGVTLYELITGTRPPRGDARDAGTPVPPPSTLVPNLSPEVDALCLRMLAFAPQDRFSTYAELHAAIAHALSPPAVPSPSPPVEPQAPSVEREARPAALLMRVVAFVLDFALLGLLAGGTVYSLGPRALAALGGPAEASTQGVFLALSWPFTALAAAALEGIFGVTIGKAPFRLVVVGPDGTRAGILRALVRNAIKFAPLIGGMLFPSSIPHGGGALLLLLSALVIAPSLGSGAMLHDRLARTKVIRRPARPT